MKKQLRYYLLQLRHRSGEHEQALIRVVFTTLMLLCLLYLDSSDSAGLIPKTTLYVMAGAVLASLLMLLVIFISMNASRGRQWFAMLADIAATSYVMSTTHEFSTLFFGIYLWVITGNCLRYGIPSLIGSYLASLAGFSMVLLFNDYWRTHPHLSLGLILTLALIPLYILKLRNQLNAALFSAKEASQAKGKFLAHMSHEMRTPLNGLVGAGDLLTATQLSGEQRDLVRTLQNSSKILQQLIENVLDFSRIESGRLVTENIDFDLHELVHNTMQMFQAQADEKGLKLGVHFTPDTAFALHGDALHLLQVLINLLGNALKFTHKGSVELRISTVQQDQASARMRFAVIDTGIGIAPEQQQSIFERFTQANVSIARKYGGSGLGTTISRELVRLMGGEIGLQSAPGIGSMFWFELPFGKQQAGSTALKPSSLEQLRFISVGLTQAEQTQISRHLAGWGVRFEHQSSLAQLLARLAQMRSNRYAGAVVLCAPGRMGLEATEFAQQALAANRSASLILLDADLQKATAETYLAAGYCCLLCSPLDKTLLFNALHGVMAPRATSDVISFKEHYERNNAARRGVRILVADDNGTNRKIVARILEHGGHKVDLVEDGEAALDKLEHKRFDLMILDMNMPGMGGLEVIKIHRALSLRTPVPAIILTANATVEALRECEEAEVDAYLTKPVDAATLLDTIAKLTATSSNAATDAPPLNTPLVSVTEDGNILLNANTLHQLALLGQGQDNFMQVVIRGFISETERLLEAMRTALANKEYIAFKDFAHMIKGSSGNIGAEALFHLCARIMQSSHSDISQNAGDLLSQMQSCFKATRTALLQQLGDADRASI